MQDKIHSYRFSHIDAYVGIFQHILTYSEIIRHIQELSRDIQAHSEASVTPVYSEFWCIQNADIFGTRAIFKTLVFSGLQVYSQPSQTSAIENFTKIIQILFCTFFSNMANSEINETGHNKVELVFNILAYSGMIQGY